MSDGEQLDITKVPLVAKKSANYGTDWRADEVGLVVADYFEMLSAELRGEVYSKAEHRRKLRAGIDRTDGSIEFKRENISAVLGELGLPWIKGYKPAANYQDALFEAIERFLEANPTFATITSALDPKSPTMPTVDYEGVLVAPPTPETSRKAKQAAPLRRLVRKFDPAARDERNRDLGREGEEFVLDFERWRLRETPKYADNVRWVSRDDGDGAGYDILSFDERGNKKLIEVKTTCGNQRTPFFLSRNEHQVAQERVAAYRIYRVFQFRNDPKIFTVAPPLNETLHLETAIYAARPL